MSEKIVQLNEEVMVSFDFIYELLAPYYSATLSLIHI